VDPLSDSLAMANFVFLKRAGLRACSSVQLVLTAARSVELSALGSVESSTLESLKLSELESQALKGIESCAFRNTKLSIPGVCN
jgi:hypothetical protein